MSRLIGVAAGSAALLAAAAGAWTLDRFSTGLPALVLCPIASAALAVSVLPRSRLGSALLAAVFTGANLWLFTTLLSFIQERRFGWIDPEGSAAFEGLMAVSGFVLAPLLAAGIANLSRT